jgi:hypothetical protein
MDIDEAQKLLARSVAKRRQWWTDARPPSPFGLWRGSFAGMTGIS